MFLLLSGRWSIVDVHSLRIMKNCCFKRSIVVLCECICGKLSHSLNETVVVCDFSDSIAMNAFKGAIEKMNRFVARYLSYQWKVVSTMSIYDEIFSREKAAFQLYMLCISSHCGFPNRYLCVFHQMD